ncbi:unnamed protein product [Acanthosepion pharaonis]|uniref:Uncharacterized protein n=1 Tax=Acanthosepion pharaonis TaxID=158019 RepID=A0A812D521_ACAPH|nr:unnamed protein product [Sepia pharaonis]
MSLIILFFAPYPSYLSCTSSTTYHSFDLSHSLSFFLSSISHPSCRLLSFSLVQSLSFFIFSFSFSLNDKYLPPLSSIFSFFYLTLLYLLHSLSLSLSLSLWPSFCGCKFSLSSLGYLSVSPVSAPATLSVTMFPFPFFLSLRLSFRISKSYPVCVVEWSIQYAPPTDRHGNRRDLSTVALVKGIRGWRGGVGLDGLTTAHAAKSTDSKCVTVVRYTERASRPSGVRANVFLFPLSLSLSLFLSLSLTLSLPIHSLFFSHSLSHIHSLSLSLSQKTRKSNTH